MSTAAALGYRYGLLKRAQAADPTPLILTHLINADAADMVAKHGLLSSTTLAKNKAALRKARPDKAEREAWLALLKQELQDQPNRAGISAMIHDTPASVKLPKNHPTLTSNLTPVGIDLSALLKDLPETQLYGMELTPFEQSRVGELSDAEYEALPPEEKDKLKIERHRFITPDELRAIGKNSPEELWRHYRPTSRPMYAPDVPHIAVLPPGGVIPPKYLIGLAELLAKQQAKPGAAQA